MNFWQGKRVRLRGIEPSDGGAFSLWNLDSELARGVDFLWPPVSQEHERKEAEALSLKKLENDVFQWIIEDTSGAAVGSISTHNCNHRTGTFSYGIVTQEEHRRKGYASEAILLVVKYYFEELRYQKVTASVYSFNKASIALHERLGFIREGTLRRMVYTNNEYFDLLWYGMTKEEWENSPHRF
ncbi:MAG TPA: GNAT family protein [Pyrinomonadaceae bacterium]|jgi:RimJ/RimL family protein N-acetyltransferase